MQLDHAIGKAEIKKDSHMRLCEQQNSGTVIIHVKFIVHVQQTNSF